MDQFEADKMGQLASELIGTTKPESLVQCDRILHTVISLFAIKRVYQRID